MFLVEFIELHDRAQLLRPGDGTGKLAVDRVRHDLRARRLVRREAPDRAVQRALGVEHHRPQLAVARGRIRDAVRLIGQAVDTERRGQAPRRVDRDDGHLAARAGEPQGERRRGRRLADTAGAEADHHAPSGQVRSQPVSAAHRPILFAGQELSRAIRISPAGQYATEDQGDGMAKVIAFANQKGGVAKTTTTLNLAAALGEEGHRVLCVDMDPQGNLTMSQGINPDTLTKSMFDVLVHGMSIREVTRRREVDVACSSIDLAGAEIAMSMMIGRERSLQRALREVQEDYDFVCIDTPPSLGLLTVNALTAADKVIVPVQCEYLSMRGLLQLQNTLQMIRENLNPDVDIEGILPTLVDSRTIHAKEALEILEENFGDRVFASRIRKTVRFAEAPVKGMSVLRYEPDGAAAESYRQLAQEVLSHGK